MARVNVYLPDRLADEVRSAGLNLSRLTQVAAERELARGRAESWLTRVLVDREADVPHETALEALERAPRAAP